MTDCQFARCFSILSISVVSSSDRALPGGRGTRTYPVDIDAPERGDLPSNPICVDDYEWSDDGSEPESDNMVVDESDHDSDCRDENRGRSPSDVVYEAQSSTQRQQTSNRTKSSQEASPDAESGRLSDHVRQGMRIHRKKFYRPPAPFRAMDVFDISDSQRPPKNVEERPISRRRCKRGQMYIFDGVEIMHPKAFDRSKYSPCFSAIRSNDIRESPFIIPDSEEDLWRDYTAEDAKDCEMVEHYLVNDEPHPDEIPVPQPIMGVCGPVASTLPRFTNLPLSTFIGDFTLEKHAEIEPSTVAFRKALNLSELKNHNILLREGAAGAAVMMKKLGLATSSEKEQKSAKKRKRKK